MLHRESSYLALPTVAIVCHNNSILAYSPLERLLPRPPDRNFDTHNNQYNDLNLVIFTSAPNLTNQTHDPLTSILALRFASYIVSQQFAKPLHWVDPNTLLGIFSYQCSWLEKGYYLSQPIPNDWHFLHNYHTYERMASKIRIIGFWLERGCCFSQPTPHERKRGYSLSQPYKHIIPRIWGYVNPLYNIFLFNQQLILLPSYPHHKWLGFG